MSVTKPRHPALVAPRLCHVMNMALAATLAFTGCRSRSDLVALHPTIQMTPETLAQASAARFDYEGTLARAEQGDAVALGRLMKFSTRTDAAGAIGHGAVLLDVLALRGDREFADSLRRQSVMVRQAVRQSLDVGEAYSRWALAGQPWRSAYPLTFSMLAG